MCDFQNAFALSQSEHDSGFSQVQQHVDAGKFVAVENYPAYCRFTDAIIGSTYRVIAVCDTREAGEQAAAHAAVDENGEPYDTDAYCEVLPRVARRVEQAAFDAFPF